MDLFREDMKRLPRLILGYIILAIGIYLTKLSVLGMSSWSVFHDGLSIKLDMTFGLITFLLGLVILLLSILFLKTKVGIGTILNIALVGFMVDFLDYIYSTQPSNFIIQLVVLIFGVLFTTLGRSLYISAKLGPGPRDGLFVGLARITKIQVKYVKITIELIVLGIGIILGGQSGIGTVILILVSGYLVQFFFGVFGFDPKTEKQSNIVNYFSGAKETVKDS